MTQTCYNMTVCNLHSKFIAIHLLFLLNSTYYAFLSPSFTPFKNLYFKNVVKDLSFFEQQFICLQSFKKSDRKNFSFLPPHPLYILYLKYFLVIIEEENNLSKIKKLKIVFWMRWIIIASRHNTLMYNYTTTSNPGTQPNLWPTIHSSWYSN